MEAFGKSEILMGTRSGFLNGNRWRLPKVSNEVCPNLMKNKLTTLLLFDLDGTIVDTEICAIEVVGRYFLRHGHKVPENDLDYLVGRTWALSVAFLLERYPIAKDLDAVELELLTEYRSVLAQSVPVIPGSVDAIIKLSSVFKLGVVSGSRRHDIESILQTLNIRKYFEHIIGFEDYSNGKPSPEPYLKALSLFDVAADSALIFEDSAAGMTSAIAAGIDVVGIGGAAHQHSIPVLCQIPNFNGIDGAWVKALSKQ